MKWMVVLGLVLVVLGGGLMIKGYVSYKDTDPVIKEIGLSKTETRHERIPLAVSGTLLGLGAVLTIVGATRKRN